MGSGKIRLVSLLCLILAMTFPCDGVADETPQELGRLVSLFECPKIDTAQFEVRQLGSKGGMRILSLRFPTALKSGIPENDVVHSIVYIPKSSEQSRLPAVVILHGLGSSDAANERYLARSFALKGMVAAVMELPYHMHRTPKGMMSGEFLSRKMTIENAMQAIRQAAMDAKRLIDWLCMQPFIDDGRLGVVGISLGGIIASLLIGIDKRLTACVNVLGGDLAMTLWESWLTRELRRSLERQGMTFGFIHSLTHWVNPTTYAPLAKGKRILMVMSEYDLIVPRRACIELWRAFGFPPMIRLHTGHLCAQFSASALKDAVTDFVKLTLIEGMESSEAASRLKEVPSVAIKSELMMPIGGNGGVGFAIELGDLDAARRTSLDLHFITGGVYVGIQWEASRHLAIGACMRLDKDHIIRPHISTFAIF